METARHVVCAVVSGGGGGSSLRCRYELSPPRVTGAPRGRASDGGAGAAAARDAVRRLPAPSSTRAGKEGSTGTAGRASSTGGACFYEVTERTHALVASSEF